MTLLIATSNHDKLREIRGLLAHIPIALISLGDLPAVPEPDETGRTFEENARIKAAYYDNALAERAAVLAARKATDVDPVFTVAEDSGLVIDALCGEPGVRSARFVGEHASYAERFAEIYRRLAERPEEPRVARFVCALVVMQRGVQVFQTSGIVEGRVADAPRGTGGFGYDPIFLYPPYGATLGEVSEEAKLRVAHRGEAFRTLAHWLRARIEERTEP